MSEPSENADTFYLIDGHAQIFRAYFAIRGGMMSPITGEPTNATFAFTGMLMKLLGELKPHYVVMAIDMPGKTFRDDIYNEYKANREAAPEDLLPQFERIFQITRLFGIPVIGQEGAEADDVIATLVAEDEQYSKDEKDIKETIRSIEKQTMRRTILDKGVRADGRGVDDIRADENGPALDCADDVMVNAVLVKEGYCPGQSLPT